MHVGGPSSSVVSCKEELGSAQCNTPNILRDGTYAVDEPLVDGYFTKVGFLGWRYRTHCLPQLNAAARQWHGVFGL